MLGVIQIGRVGIPAHRGLMTNLNDVVGAKYFSPQNDHDKSGRKMFRPYSHFILLFWWARMPTLPMLFHLNALLF